MSPEYFQKIQQNKQLHAAGKAHKGRTRRYHHYLKQIVDKTHCKTCLDWGSGRALQWTLPLYNLDGSPYLQQYLSLQQVTCYDPAVEEFQQFPAEQQWDLIICTDVLSLIPETDLSWVFEQMRLRCAKALFVVVNSDQLISKKRYPDGSSKQVTIKSRNWWLDKFFRSADWSEISVYWKWSEDGRDSQEKIIPISGKGI